ITASASISAPSRTTRQPFENLRTPHVRVSSRRKAVQEHGVETAAQPGARAASYSVAGAVRRGLEAVGFKVEKKPGFGAKRERAEARFEGAPRTDPYPLLPYDPGATPPARVAVVGGGIAGAAVAHAFARRGVAVTLCERAPRLGAGASGNPAGLVMPRLDRDDGPIARFFRAAHLYALDAYRGGFVAMDVVERARSARDAIAIEDLARDPPFADDLLGSAPGALVHRGAGLVRPGEWIARWTQGADLRLSANVRAIAREGTGWRVVLDGAEIEADAVIVAAGPNLAAFADLPVVRRAGQIEWADSQASGPAVTSGAYAAPFDGGLLFGATFDATEADEAKESFDARARNLAALDALAPDWAAAVRAAAIHSRASVRATTPDRAPIAGLALDALVWRERFAGLAKGATVDRTTPAPHLAGLYLLGGLGARGLSLAPLLAECVASACCGEPAPLDQDVLDAIHPGRFALRALRRGRI
ncbi:MAG: FAD-dependent oxidoreductase, partial [Alphaproteobacteria bacterium]|nr:FAD-dependent oxidoreductase [Alphaproteobacteria bacterium]